MAKGARLLSTNKEKAARSRTTTETSEPGQTSAGTSETAGDASPTLVVGVGASAGGLDACQRFLQHAPADQGMAFVVILHLAPAGKSHVAEILQRVTAMKVSQVTGSERVEPDHVYVIAAGTSLGVHDGALGAGAPEEPHHLARPIDTFFSALAADRQESAVGIVLSGTGSDGSAGLEAIRSAGGLCLAQDPETAEYDGMPRSAINTRATDTAVPPEEMGDILRQYAATPRARPANQKPPVPAAGEPGRGGLPGVLELLGKRYDVDFRDYKVGTLQRRTERRIELKRLSGWPDYLDYLETHAEEVDALYSDLLVGVTSFFRDPEEWEHFEREVVPELVEERGDTNAVRAWSAGCATGEEAYSLAIVLLEHLETAGSRLGVKIFASDASPGALATARRGQYPGDISDQVSAGRLERFFRPSADGFAVANDLRSAVTFAAHDLLSDPPFPRLDLVTCRNVMIYLEPAAQERLLERFHFALRPGGKLWLGAAETVGRRTDLFAQVPGGRRIYRASASGRAHSYSLAARRLPPVAPAPAPTEAEAAPPNNKVPRLVEKLVLQRHTLPCVVVG